MASRIKPLPRALLIAAAVALPIWAYTQFWQKKEAPDNGSVHQVVVEEPKPETSSASNTPPPLVEPASVPTPVQIPAASGTPVPPPNAGMEALLEAGKRK